jgi:hypothetical protein
MSLFEGAPVLAPKPDFLRDELASIDVNLLRPIDALQILSQLKEKHLEN